MEQNELEELEKMVNAELQIADVYKCAIPESSINDIRKYFNDKRAFKLLIHSHNPQDLVDMGKKYEVVFSISNRGR